MAYAALLGLALFFIGWGVAFFVSLARAPAQLDGACQQMVGQLRAELALPDEALANHLRGLLAQISENATKVLRFVLLHEQIDTLHIKIEGLAFADMQKARSECITAGLLRINRVGGGDDAFSIRAMLGAQEFYYVPPEFRQILQRLLYTSVK